jgi:hypothetical protein
LLAQLKACEGQARATSPALLAKRRQDAEASQHGVSEGQDANPVRHGICASEGRQSTQAGASCALVGVALS